MKNIKGLGSVKETNVIEALKKTTSQYSVEVLKLASSQGTLSTAQATAIFKAKGLTGAALEQAVATAALSASQKGATTSTVGLSAAFKGLAVSIKSAAVSAWAFLTTNPVGWLMLAVGAVAGVVAAYDALTTSLDEQKEKLDEVKDAYKGITDELSELEGEIQSNIDKIRELENIPNPTWVDQEELDRLREVTKELELQKSLKEEEQLKAAEGLYEENKETYEMEFSGAYGYSVNDVKEALSAGDVGIVQLDLQNNIVDMVAALHYLEEEKSKLTDLDEIAGYDLYIDQITAQIKESGNGFLSSLSSYKQNILEIASIRDLTEEEQDFYDSLSSMQKMIYEFYSPATWNNLELDSIFDTEGIEKTKDELLVMAKEGKLTPETISGYTNLNNAIEKSELFLKNGQRAAQAFCDEMNACAEAKDDLDSGNGNETPIFAYDKLGDIPSKLSEIESAYKTATDALEEYNKTGTYSMSTIDSILSLSNDYINALVDENGQVQINEESISRLAAIKIEASKASVYQEACEELVRLKTLDTSIAAQELALTNGTLTESAYNVAKALYEEVVAMGGANAVLAGNVWDTATKKVKVLDNQLKNLNNCSYNVGKSKTADSIVKAAKDAQQATKDHIEAYMDYMEKSLEAGRMDYQRYTHDVSGFLKNMYDDGKISAKEYFDYNKQMLEYQKSVMDQAISAVDYRLEKEIDSYNDQIASIEERYQTELDYLDTVIQYYEDQKAALQDSNDEVDRQLKLEQALYAFEMAQNQKTKKVYTSGSGFVYKADGTAVKDASQDLRNAKLDIEIAKLEEAIKQVEKQQEALQDTMEAETAALEDIIFNLEAYRDKWKEIAGEYEIAQNNLLAAQLLGADWESQIIDGRLDTLNTFRDSYAAIQQELVDLAWKAANEQIKAAQEAKKGADGTTSSGTVSDIKGSSKITQRFEVVHMKTGKTVETFDSKKEAKAYVDKLNQRIDKLGTPSSYIIRAKTYHKGLEEGLVGDAFGSEDFRLVQKFGLQDSEVSAVLQKNEAVLTEVQIGNIANALKLLPVNSIIPNIHMPDYSTLTTPASKHTEPSVVQQISVTLPNITNEAGFNRFKKEMDRLRLDAYQYAHRRHR